MSVVTTKVRIKEDETRSVEDIMRQHALDVERLGLEATTKKELDDGTLVFYQEDILVTQD